MLRNDCVPKLHDVLVAKDGSYLKEIFVNEKENKKAILSSIAIFRPNLEIVDAYFLCYLLKTPMILNYVKDNCVSGSALPRIILRTFRGIELTIPELEIQRKIVKIIKSINAKIRINNEINNDLHELGKELVSNCEIGNDIAVKLIDVMKFINGFAFKNSDYDENGKYKIITIKNVQDGYIDSIKTDRIVSIPEKMKKECILNIGDVLLSLTGNVGRVGIVYEENMLLNQRVAKFEPYNKELLPYLYFKFLNPTMRKQLENISKGTAQQNLSPIETLKLKINYNNSRLKSIIPTLNAIFNKIINNKIEEKKLVELRDTLLPKLMNGEIDLDNMRFNYTNCDL